MRFTYAEALCDPAFLPPLARAAEEAGYDSFLVPDSLIYPAESDTLYPYTPGGDRKFLEDKPMLEPFTLIPWLSAVTERITFTVSVLKLAVRPPVLVAKQAASVAVMSNGRLRLGVGLSPWPEDFVALDQPWEKRGARMNEMIEIVRGITAGGWFEYHGEHIDVPRLKINPVPDDPIPILVGGHSAPALRRAARLGDGWIHAGGDLGELPSLLDRLHELRAECGRDGDPFEVHAISLDAYTTDGIARLEEAGVTDVIVGFRVPYTTEPDVQTLDDKIAALRGYAENVIART
ncbi:MAG: TIGR03619 family F420-dependent LLM class oxidoreductase [Acidimicrobiia bacterium]|nr:TIGR03619 family F420-dependent LLM class oxidoreductase [Acidimicrobiia bacterium]